MTAARLSRKEAEQLGLNLADAGPPVRGDGTRTRQRMAMCDSRCVADGELFTTEAAQTRHFLANPTHRRYECVIDA